MRNNLLHSARARFAATAAVVFALVAIGGVTAPPALAAPASVTITVQDNAQGGLLPNRTLTLESQDGSFSAEYTTSSSAEFTVTVEEGSYRLVPGGQYVPSAYFTISAAQPTISVPVTKPKIAGSIPAGAANGHTSVRVEKLGQYTNGPNYSYAEVANFVVGNADGSFSYLLQTGPGDYRLVFQPDATVPYLNTDVSGIDVDGTVDTVSIGAVTLPPAGSISGTITGTPGGTVISGAAVKAMSGATTVATTTTGADGTYFLKLAAAPATVTVTASATGYDTQSYAVTLSSGNSFSASSVNIALPRLPANVSGNLTQYGGGNEPYAADIYLYKYDTTTAAYLATPYGTQINSANFSFSDLPDGNYRLAFRDSATDRILTWRIRDRYVSPGYPSGGYGDCSLDFTISTGGDRQLPNIELTQQVEPGYCASPPFSSPSDKTVTGTVTNTASLSPTVYAKLYAVDGGGGFTLVDIGAVNATTGDYSLGGVREDGEYFVQFAPDAGSSYLPLLLGDGGVTAWAKDAAAIDDFAANETFTVDINDPSTLSGHDAELVQGALFTGTLLTGFGDAIHGQVTFANVNDPSDTLTVTGNGDGWGSWRAVLPVGGTYSMRASALEGYYASEYWQDAASLADADTVTAVAGNNGSYEFRLAASPASLYGYVNDVTDDDPITVHLFNEDSYGTWQPVAVLDSVDAAVYFTSLAGGVYRMRFEKNGQWLETVSSRTGTLPDTSGSYSAPTCFVDIADVANGTPSFIEANFDSGNQTTVCGPEAAPEGDVTGHVVSSAATGDMDVAGVTVMLMDGIYLRYFDAVTNAQGEFTIEDVPNGDYGIVITPTMGTHVNGTHEYFYVAEDSFEGGKDLGDIVPTRMGNVSGDIENWDESTMAGASAMVYEYIDCGCADPSWEPVGIPVEIDEDGHFEAPGVVEDGQYSVFIDFDGTYVDTFVGGGTAEPTAPFTGTAEQDYSYPTAITLDIVELVAITGTAFYGDFPLEYGYVYAELSDGTYYETEVTEDGSYELLVAPNQDYLVSVEYDSLMTQYWEGVNYDPSFGGPFTGTPVVVDDVAVSGINFSLIAPEQDAFYLYTGRDAGFPGASYQFSDVEVHLYQYVVDGWEEVASELTSPYATLTSSGGGDYRLRFSKDGEWLNVEQAQWDNDLPPFDESGGYVAVDSCFIEFSDLDHGSQVSVDAILDPDGATSDCGPEDTAEHFEVLGSTVQSDALGNSPIVGQTVTLTNTTTGYVFTKTTDSNGVYDFTGVSAGTYTLDIPTAVGTSGYAYESHTETVVVDDLEALDPIELTRYGNVELELLPFNASMAGATAQVQIEGPAGVWTPVGLPGTVDSSGLIVVPAIAANGTYRVWVDMPAGFVDGYVTEWYSPDVTYEFDGVAESDVDGLAFRVLTTVSGVVRLGATAVAGAEVTAENSVGYVWSTTTASDGSFSMAVQVGETFTLEATKAGLVRAIDTAFTVSYQPVSNVDLEMKFATFLTTVKDATDTPLTTATVHLYRQVTGGWQEVASDTWSTTYLWANLSGSYRIRVSDGANWLALNGSACVVDYTPAVGGTEYTLALTATPSTICAAEPAVVAPPVTPGTSGSGTKKPVTFATTPVAAEEETEVAPTSSPTPTATPAPSESATADPDGATGVDKPDSASAPDLTWVFVVAGILVLLVLAGGAVYLVRRRP